MGPPISPTAPFVLPPPPPDRGRFARLCMYFAAVMMGLAGVLSAGPLSIAGALLFAGLAYLLFTARQKEIGAALAMAALDRAARGRFAEARALLSAISKRVLSSHVGMMVDTQRAALSLYEGDLETAVAEATRGVRAGQRLDAMKRIHQGSALSIRAVALAGLGRKEEALADIAAVRSARYRQGSFVARASLAEAMLFARERDLESLGRVLHEDGPLLFGATSPRERLVARALSRLVAAKKVSVYREPAKREEQELDENASWVARLAPEAAAYARAPRLGAQLEAPEAIDPRVIAGADKNAPKAQRPMKRVLTLWGMLVVMFLAIWQFLTPSSSHHQAAIAPAASGGVGYGSTMLLVLAMIGALAGLIAFRVARGRKLLEELSRNMELRQRGQHEQAKAAFTQLAKSKVPLVAPQAHRELATIAIADGDFETAKTHAEAGISGTRATPATLALSRPVLLPQLHGVLAFALAASGRERRAAQELAELPKLFPAYPYLARDTFSARLAGLAANGKLHEAAAMARERPADLPLSMQEELLCDALRLHAGDVLPEGERERIQLDLHDDRGAARCVARLAPKLGSRSRVAEDDAPASQQEEDGEEEDDAVGKKHLALRS